MRFLSRLNPRVRKAVDWVVGVLLILFGIIAGPIPVLQGWMFILAGLAVLSRHNRWAKAIYDRVKQMGRKVRDRVVRRRAESREQEETGDETSGQDAHAPPTKDGLL